MRKTSKKKDGVPEVVPMSKYEGKLSKIPVVDDMPEYGVYKGDEIHFDFDAPVVKGDLAIYKFADKSFTLVRFEAKLQVATVDGKRLETFKPYPSAMYPVKYIVRSAQRKDVQ
jgi:hypothetical protein